MKAVVFLSGLSMGDALSGVGRLWQDMFERLGYVFVEVRLSEPNGLAVLHETANQHEIEAAISFVGMAAELGGMTKEGNQVNFWEHSRIPFLSLYGDSPAYFFDRHVLPGKMFAALYGFPEHYVLRKRLPRMPGMMATIPPLVVDPVPKEEIDFRAKEAGKLFFLKNGNDPDQLLRSWSSSLTEPLFEMLADLAYEVAGNLGSPKINDLDTLVDTYFLEKGFDVDNLLNVRLFFIAQLDDYCRRLKSTLIAEAMMDLPVEVHGYNWDHLKFESRRAKLVPVGDFATSRQLIKGALGIIDMSPNTGLVPHERPRRAFGAFTLCLTNKQEYFTNNFADHQSFTFDFTKEAIQEKVAEVLGNPKRYVELGIDVAEQFRRDEDPDAAARLLLNVANLVRLQNANRFPNLQNYFVWPPKTIV